MGHPRIESRPPWGSTLGPPALRVWRNGLATAIPHNDRGLRPLGPPICVTHVPGQKCYPCPRLHKASTCDRQERSEGAMERA